MSRKLIHSIRAIVVSFGVLAAVAAIGLPSVAPSIDAARTQIAAAAATAPESAVAPSTESDLAAPAPKKHSPRRRLPREEMSLPFFSFAHGLRRGNGS